MGFKKTNSPIKQFGLPGSVISSLVNQPNQGAPSAFGGSIFGNIASQVNPAQTAAISAQQQPIASGSMISNMAALTPGVQNPNVMNQGVFANSLSRSMANTQKLKNNMTPRPQTPVNPKALGNNTRTIANMYGRSMPGSFDRNMGPLMQMADPLTGQVIDPTMDQSTAGMNPVVQGDTAIAPPEGVEVPITPIYDINQ
jgi:hypothetical protein